MEWRSVQELRPRVSTSAGQSFGGAARVEAARCDLEIDLLWAAHAENEVQDRQLRDARVG
jgi:hypothetical protein